MPQIVEQYVSTGKVYFVFRDLPLTSIHPGALQAAHAANCAADQGRFWEMHARLFAGQSAREWAAGGERDLDVFLEYGTALGVDSTALRSCIAERRHAARIEEDVRSAVGRGLTSTPAYVVNGRPLLGARPFESWKQVFDSLLANP